jgi:predicted unusual protein kinase regulating ubiquinone biosynthesis (AarF/ABC1/UbiB family)
VQHTANHVHTSCLRPLFLPPQEARNIEEFGRNFATDPTVKIPWVRRDLCGSQVVVMEWIEGIRCTDFAAIRNSGVDVDEFIR